MWFVPSAKAATSGVCSTVGFAMTVLDGRELLEAEGTRLVRLRLLCPLLGTTGAYDEGSNEIVDDDDVNETEYNNVEN